MSGDGKMSHLKEKMKDKMHSWRTSCTSTARRRGARGRALRPLRRHPGPPPAPPSFHTLWLIRCSDGPGSPAWLPATRASAWAPSTHVLIALARRRVTWGLIYGWQCARECGFGIIRDTRGVLFFCRSAHAQ